MSNVLFIMNLDCADGYETEKEALYCLTLSTTLTSIGDNDVTPLLCPWKWVPSQMHYWIRKAGSDLGEKKTTSLVKYSPKKRTDGATAAMDVLDGKFTEYKDGKDGKDSDQARFWYDPRKDSADETASAKWVHLLEDAVRLPAPLGHELNLVYFFRVREELEEGETLIAAPEFTYPEGNGLFTPISAKKDTLWKVTYENDAVIGLTPGYSNKPPLPRWLKISAGGKDWQAEFPMEVAQAMHPARVFMAAAREFSKTDPNRTLLPDEVAMLRKAVLRALRAGAHSGGPGFVLDNENDATRPAWSPAPRTADSLLQRMDGIDEKDRAEAAKGLRVYEKESKIYALDDSSILIWASVLTEALGEAAPPWLMLAAKPSEKENKNEPKKERDKVENALKGERLVSLRDELAMLDALVESACDAETLERIVAAHWRAAFIHAKLAAEDLKGILDKLPGVLKDMPLAVRLVLDTISTKTTGREAMWMKLVAADKKYLGVKGLCEKFGDLAVKELKYVFNLDMSGILNSLEGEMKKAAQAVGPESDTSELGEASDLPTAQPLAFLVGDDVRATQGMPIGKDDSLLTRLAGVGLLLRRAKTRDKLKGASWTCPALASVYGPPEELFCEAGLAPFRQSEAGGLENWTICYDNGPISAEGVKTKLAGNVVLKDTTQMEKEGTQPHAWAKYGHPIDGDKARLKLLALAYGYWYEAAAFPILNGGVIPPDITNGEPITFDLTKLTKNLKPCPSASLRCLRRTPVEAPRLVAAHNTAPLPLQYPPIPRDEGVYPLWDDLKEVVARSETSAPAPEDTPVVLLVEKDDSAFDPGRTVDTFSFGVLPPAVDVHVFQRWLQADVIAAIDGAPSRLATVLADFYRIRHAASQDVAEDAPQPDTTIDDPACTHMRIVLERIGLNDFGMPRAFAETFSAIVAVGGHGTSRIAAAQAAIGKVTVSAIKETGKESVVWEKWIDGGTVAVRKGQLYRLRMQTLVESRFYLTDDEDADSPDARFRRWHKWVDREISDAKVPKYIVAAETPLLIEVATETKPASDDVWRAIAVLGRQGEDLLVGFDPAALGDAGNSEEAREFTPFDYVKLATLERQRWSWRGRRLLRAFPFDAAFDAAKVPKEDVFVLEPATGAGASALEYPWRKAGHVVEWDESGFGDRENQDRLIESGAFPAPARRLRGTPAHSEIEPVARGLALQRIGLGRDPRAMYFRYFGTMRNRYWGLLQRDKQKELGEVRTVESRQSQATKRPVSYYNWRRLVVKARVTRSPAAPGIRFILPLTQSEKSDTSPDTISGVPVAPLLVLTSGAWGDTAGLVELLEAEVVQIERRYDPVKRERRWVGYEIGHDPIESTEVVYKPEVVTSSEPAPLKVAIEVEATPIGLTFEPGADAPKIATSAWTLMLRNDHESDPLRVAPGVMAKLRFRNTLQEDGTVAWGGAERKGPWSEPHWIQLLADFAWFPTIEENSSDSIVRHVSDLIIKDNQLHRKDPKRPIRVLPQYLDGTADRDARTRERTIVVVLTEVVGEAGGGGHASEVFLAFGMYKDGEPMTLDFQPDPGIARQTRRARVIEVEHVPGKLTAPKASIIDIGKHPLVQALYPRDETPDSDIARIIRISPPIESVPPR